MKIFTDTINDSKEREKLIQRVLLNQEGVEMYLEINLDLKFNKQINIKNTEMFWF